MRRDIAEFRAGTANSSSCKRTLRLPTDGTPAWVFVRLIRNNDSKAETSAPLMVRHASAPTCLPCAAVLSVPWAAAGAV